MLVLLDTPAGFALYSLNDDAKVSVLDTGCAKDLATLQGFCKFDSTTEALAATTCITESKLPKQLKHFLRKTIKKQNLTGDLCVADPKLGGVIKEKMGINCIFDSNVLDIMKAVKEEFEKVIPFDEMKRMSLGLAHSLSRFKLKFSPDKVDVMIVQAIGLLDDLDKELNTYAMRVREWYGWHFPELNKIIVDNIQFARTVKKMGVRHNAITMDFSDILANDVEAQMKEAAHVTMGVDISADDVVNVRALCDQVIEIDEYRTQLHEYLKNRMQAVAPNVSTLVGELVGARLISHAGSLLTLAKYPSSTVQILGAEKALFRALKTMHSTPKYGLIYHASLVGKAAPKFKGKMSRMLANKLALSARVDALGETNAPNVGTQYMEMLEKQARVFENGIPDNKSAGSANRNQAKAQPYRRPATYNDKTDVTPAVAAPKISEVTIPAPVEEKKKEEPVAAEAPVAEAEPVVAAPAEEKKKEKKEHKHHKKAKTEEEAPAASE
nr:nucleolar protein 5 [Paratrimastix eleionoma]